MVSLGEKIAINELIDTDANLRAVADLLDGNKIRLSTLAKNDIRTELLKSIADNDKNLFMNIGNKISKRTISADADWCHDDFLIFLLILGNHIFGRQFEFIEKVIEVRRNNPNPFPQKINEIFSALYRQDFAISGELAFLKIPFLHLIGHTYINTFEAKSVFQTLSKPGILNQLSPFFKVLTVKAYDIILFDRTQFKVETTEQLISLVEQGIDNLKLKDLWKITLSLPIKIIASMFAIIGSISISICAGIIWIKSEYSEYIARDSSDIKILNVDQNIANLPGDVIRFLPPVTNKNNLVIIRSNITTTDKKSFVVELSYGNASVIEIFSFVQNQLIGARPFTVIPIQKDGVRYRAFVPDIKSESQLVFVVLLDKTPSKDVGLVFDNFILKAE
jgi:hypothetical protein